MPADGVVRSPRRSAPVAASHARGVTCDRRPNAERYALDSNPWLHKSALAIKGLIIAARTRNIEVYCGMLDVLIDLGWRGQIERLRARVEDLIRSNIPPREGKLGREGQGLLDWLRTVADEKPK